MTSGCGAAAASSGELKAEGVEVASGESTRALLGGVGCERSSEVSGTGGTSSRLSAVSIMARSMSLSKRAMEQGGGSEERKDTGNDSVERQMRAGSDRR